MADPQLDFRLLFEASPDVLLALLPDSPRFTMVAATEARLSATHTTREQTIGRGIFELFPDNPDDPAASGTRALRASLERVLATRAPDTMAVQKYDIRGPDGTFEVKHWSPKNIPVLSPAGQVLYILHRVEDVTDLVHASEVGEELRDQNRAMEREVIVRSRELAEANAGLREANVKLGALDAAKTAFFSNVSHELRTPLALMLGPLEDALTDGARPLLPDQRARVELAHGNALRMLKLVNTLLEFARIEAGRQRARFAPLDVARFSTELARMFESAAHAAGLRLVTDCPPLDELPWVDREMWERIVPNLVSNAFKFTFAGEITVRTREEPGQVVLEVQDTGVGIPETELPRIFDRFHRVAGSAGRTHEGSGIGLALVRELVQLHGGTVSVESHVGAGSLFRVTIPKGSAHLPADALAREPVVDAQLGVGRDAAAWALEAARWVGSDEAATAAVAPVLSAPEAEAAESRAGGPRALVLVVDDNADLRAYIGRLLAPTYEVVLAKDGAEGLEAVGARLPDVVVSDVMMPRLDGFGLVRALRAEPRTASLPVILLSARAGEEAAIDGLDAGCDDYLVKPFSARELLARVRTHVTLARARRAWAEELERANHELDAFSYSVSHDLRAPLRAIDGFSLALAEDCADALDDEGRSHVERIRSGVGRMATLIDALLELARLARAPLRQEAVDLSQIAEAVVAELRRADPGRAVDVEIAPGLSARGDHRLLEVALANLLGNAWKYTSRTPEPRIRVARAAGDAEPTFLVQDNGAGFDMAYASKLFAPFQRLHRAAEFEGTGVGLATVQRVVARHGGRIWAEAEVGRGATFFFTLPERSAR